MLHKKHGVIAAIVILVFLVIVLAYPYIFGPAGIGRATPVPAPPIQVNH